MYDTAAKRLNTSRGVLKSLVGGYFSSWRSELFIGLNVLKKLILIDFGV